MPNKQAKLEFELSVIVTVVGGRQQVERCLQALVQQSSKVRTEIIVPYDIWSKNVGDLVEQFPEVTFHFINNLGFAASDSISAHQHRLYDRRRAVGIALARGRVVALLEDYAVPKADWCDQVVRAHLQPHAVIGGAIENGVDHPLNWALYYCDFGRYGSPFNQHEVEYASDVNISYKYDALHSMRDVWHDAYHETLVNWALGARGEKIVLDPRIVVFEKRPQIAIREALRERVAWGRVFAESRVVVSSRIQRISYIIGTTGLPLLLLYRVLRHMLRQRRSLAQLLTTLPLSALLLTAWSIGELIGYISGPIEKNYSLTQMVPET